MNGKRKSTEDDSQVIKNVNKSAENLNLFFKPNAKGTDYSSEYINCEDDEYEEIFQVKTNPSNENLPYQRPNSNNFLYQSPQQTPDYGLNSQSSYYEYIPDYHKHGSKPQGVFNCPRSINNGYYDKHNNFPSTVCPNALNTFTPHQNQYTINSKNLQYVNYSDVVKRVWRKLKIHVNSPKTKDEEAVLKNIKQRDEVRNIYNSLNPGGVLMKPNSVSILSQ